MIAITGATGAVGRRVAIRLAEIGLGLRLLVRDPGRAPVAGADLARIAGYDDSPGLHTGLADCDVLFLVSGRESADRVRQHRTVIEAAVDVGVRKVVYLSFQGAAPDATFTFARDHWHTEQLIGDSGVRFVLLRDCFYFAALVGLVGADGVIRGPAGEGCVAAVSHDDVAAAAAAALTTDQWDGSTLDVTGPEALTLGEVAAGLSSISGRDVRYINESEQEAYRSRAHYDAPDFEVRGWVTSYQAIANGEVSAVSDTVERLTGDRPRSFEAYLTAHPASWAHLAEG